MSPPNLETQPESEFTCRPSAVTNGMTKINNNETIKFERDYIPPNFTIKEIRAAIPPHCFERNALKSASYIVKDLAVIAILVYAATFIDTYLPTLLRYVAWLTYWFFCGAFATGVWVLAHECGHQAFSTSSTLNNTVGFILHTALLVPYHSWRITHSKHHKHTSLMHKDQVFVPKTRSKVEKKIKHETDFKDAPIITLLNLIGQQLFGWPLYLTLNFSGQTYDKGIWANHFNPKSPFFDSKNYYDIIISNIGMIVALSTLSYFVYTYSFIIVAKYYLIPYLIVNHWLVLITYLQHTDPKVPHYREGQWDFIRGAACTVDRHMGFLDAIFHRITSTHVAHHYFSTMPHYHAEEATKHLTKVLGSYYLFDDTPIFKALWRNYNECHYIEDEGDVVFYKSFKA
ncbi:4952_t:CDS:2 [Diversispora eburnea]|uniref:4952_t:CDS:1 n=1 Tax=Diversispora eburnea TaxID=1213867 RepID=A0A9N8W7D9_9GLOM|nr:4952_t:CDS:2 [Diversispora eburnea]